MSIQSLDLPLLPLRDVVVYPHMVLPLFVGREKSIKALQSAMDGGKEILLVAQKIASEDEPRAGELYEVGPSLRFCSFSNSLMGLLKS